MFFHFVVCKFLTLVLDDLYTSALHKNGVEFHQEFNGHGPRHVTCVLHVSNTFFFHFQFNGHSPSNVTRDIHMSNTCFSFRYSTVFENF